MTLSKNNRHPEPNLCDAARGRAGFTLIEIMVSLVLISILSGMVMVGIRSTQQHSRQVATRGLIKRIDLVLRTKWDEYRYRPLAVQIDNTAWTYDPNRTPPQILPESAGRVRLMMLRDLMRMEMPDRRTDLVAINGTNVTRRGPTVIETATSTYDDASGQPNEFRIKTQIPWDPRTGNYESYLARITQAYANGNQWTSANESAECLYMILSSTTVNGISALDVIAPVQIQDTDGDSFPEIVDAWGNPISWIRWPAGSPHPTIRNAGEDEFDILATDWGIVRTNVEKPYSLTPMVISPGPDGVLGIYTIEYPTLPYSEMLWPPSQTEASTPLSQPYYYIDPFDRVNTGGISSNANPPTPNLNNRPGAVVPGQTDFITDNISSFDL
jgi:prepilin-type N-terminal cleavage/methylation domain-containing protein